MRINRKVSTLSSSQILSESTFNLENIFTATIKSMPSTFPNNFSETKVSQNKLIIIMQSLQDHSSMYNI